MPEYLYSNINLFGAIGISDYTFYCLIEAFSEEEALAWGNQVAIKYDEQIGLMPCGDKLSLSSIMENAFVDVEVSAEKKHRARYKCKVGEMPIF